MNEQQLAAGPEPVDQLTDEFLGRFRQGERPSITDYVQAHPDLAAEIRELFPALVVLERLGPRQEEIAGQQVGADPRCPIPQNLGEYRILREVGRGGMGVVYEAEQTPLGRRVALKVLASSAVLNPSVLTRFQNEVRAAARLHHTNIVPVFGVGEDQGTHYYAMQFIVGQGLDVVLQELRKLRRGFAVGEMRDEPPSGVTAGADVPEHPARGNATSHGATQAEYFQSVARMGLQVAEALAHAHSQGVLHRDIKPSNLLLDAQGSVWVTDFGLAKQAGCDVTGSGDVVGTLRYMAPERFRGSSDAESDIYGLGVTLYELLTMQPAFTATDRDQLVHDIVHCDPPPLRRLERRIPRDLETIVLKAMAKRPADRYATAAEMAADLRRFLDDKPIGARRQSASERLWRWCVRRPALASLAAALLVSLVAGVAGICWQWARAETHLKSAVKQKGIAEEMLVAAKTQQGRAEQNLQEAGRQEAIAKREAERAEDNFQTAKRSVNELLTLVSEDDLMDQPGFQPVRLKLLTKAIEFHEQMFADRDHDPAARRDLALAYFRLGRLKREMGPPAGEVEAYRRAIALLESADARTDREPAILLARVCNNLAVRHVDDGQTAEAQKSLLLARERIDQVQAEAPGDVAAQLVSAMTFNNLAYSISESLGLDFQGRKEEAIRIHEQAMGIYRRAAEHNPEDIALKNHVATTLSNMARRHISLKNSDEARRLLEECLAIRLEVASRQPASLSAQFNIAATHNALGDVVLRSSDRTSQGIEQAAGLYQRAFEIQERLARENPAVLSYRQHVSGTRENLRRLYREAMLDLGLRDRPAELLAMANSRREQLEGNDPQELLWLSADLHMAANAASRAVVLDQPQAAIAQCRQTAVALFRAAAAASPGEAAEFARGQGHMRRFAVLVPLDADLARRGDHPAKLHQRGRTLQLVGELLSAKADMDKAGQLLDAKLRDSPDDLMALRIRTVVHFDEGRWEQAIADSTRALALRASDATMLSVRSRACIRLGQWQQAHDDLKRALALQPQRFDLWPQRCRAAHELGLVNEARDTAARLVEIGGDNVLPVETMIWGLLADRQVARFPEEALALARRSSELATQATHRRPLGGVYFQLGRFQDSVEAIRLDEIKSPGETAAFAAFWLAMSHHHLGRPDEARQMFELGVRHWKAAAVLTPSREEYLRSTWQEAQTLLFGSEEPAARS